MLNVPVARSGARPLANGLDGVCPPHLFGLVRTGLRMPTFI